jgi:glycerate-2-kinase
LSEKISFSSGDFRSNIDINPSSHPIPDINGLEGTKKMVELIQETKQTNDNILIIVLISGGGSALMSLPKSGIELIDLQEINSLLIKCGADINEINSVRKHLSKFKGGNLARFICPKKAITMIVSDVIGDSMDLIASGPTVPDSTTFSDAYNVFTKYNILNKTPENVKKLILTGMNGEVNENPKKSDLIFQSIDNLIIGSARTAKDNIIQLFDMNGFENISNILDWAKIRTMMGEARDYGKYLADIISKVSCSAKSLQQGRIFYMINSGELTVTIQGDGIGGRNQEMLLGFINEFDVSCLENLDFVVCSMNMDGKEGNSPAAGAIVDSGFLHKIKNLKSNPIQYLENNDSFNFFKKINDAIEIGATETNVNDIICVLIRVKNE